MRSILAEAGTSAPFSCFAIGALVFPEDAGELLRQSCEVTPERMRWSDVDADLVAEGLGLVRSLLGSVELTNSEFQVIVCRKEDFHVWNQDPRLGFETAFTELSRELRRDPARLRRASPLVTDAHVRQNFGLGSSDYIQVVPTSPPSANELVRVQQVSSFFVSAIVSDTDEALRPMTNRNPEVLRAAANIAGFIGVNALRNDSWPVAHQRSGGQARHNIWHFPTAFRSTPGASTSPRIVV